VIAVALLAAVAATQHVKIRVDGLERRYRLHVPAVHDSPAPLILAFHGGGNTPKQMEKMTGLSALADREGFIVAYPEGVKDFWNDGRGTMRSAKSGVDDVAFTRAVIEDIQRRATIDTSRIYATGISNGGILTNRLGCAMADTFAAIGPVVATLASNVAQQCRPSEPIGVIGIISVDDPRIPFAGGETGGSTHEGVGGQVEGGRATEELWAKVDGCNLSPAVVAIPARVDDGTSVAKRAYSECKNGTAVVWYEISGGGHRWPPYHPHSARAAKKITATFGKSSQNIDATAVLWEFFKTQRKSTQRRGTM
jgi:polyhydroxybutyrate depolymerase